MINILFNPVVIPSIIGITAGCLAFSFLEKRGWKIGIFWLGMLALVLGPNIAISYFEVGTWMSTAVFTGGIVFAFTLGGLGFFLCIDDGVQDLKARFPIQNQQPQQPQEQIHHVVVHQQPTHYYDVRGRLTPIDASPKEQNKPEHHR